jgi:hypothetical protein
MEKKLMSRKDLEKFEYMKHGPMNLKKNSKMREREKILEL